MNPGSKRIALVVGILLVLVVIAAGVSRLLGLNPFAGAVSQTAPIPCRDLTTLRNLKDNLVSFTNPRTGDTLQYVVIGDGAVSSELLLMFNGTSQILPDWSLQMFTNSATSPKMVGTAEYTASEDSNLSICHDYRIVLFDYPGVGDSPLTKNIPFDNYANDADAMLNDIGTRYNIPTNQVSVSGWSLGSLMAQKFAFLSPAANPSRTIRNMILIATKPGGNTDGVADGHQSACVTTIFDALRQSDLNPKLKLDMQGKQLKLMYPYKGQQPYDSIDSGCSATIDTAANAVNLSVEPDCGLTSQCEKFIVGWLLNRKTAPWSKTDGISQALYEQQRLLVTDWNFFYCKTATANFTSTDCSGTPNMKPVMSETNGGLCQTVSNPANEPVSSNCVSLNIQGKLTVLNGAQDLMIQWTYGKALVEGYQKQYGADKAALVTYPGSDGAGHGILLQHPKWTQEQIHAVLSK